MSLEKLNAALALEVAGLAAEGRAKAEERITESYVPARGDLGPRYRLQGSAGEFLRMNSNSYLSLSQHPAVLEAAEQASRTFGAGPGAVRFIDGTSLAHTELERGIARFLDRPAACIFNSAYTSTLGLALTLSGPETYWIGDALNHNCIIRAMRIASVPRERRSIFAHNDVRDLRRRLDEVPAEVQRVIVIFDGIFSMRGDHAPLDRIVELVAGYDGKFRDGVILAMDDSHGIGAYGASGRGTEEHCRARADIIVGTFGKAFGVNGGFIAGSPELIEALRQKSDTYIYTNSLGAADCAAAARSVELVDGPEGRKRLEALGQRTAEFRAGLKDQGLESIPGPHPVVPLLVRDTQRIERMVRGLYERRILAVGLTFPVVPHGDETIRFQINASHTPADIEQVLRAIADLES